MKSGEGVLRLTCGIDNGIQERPEGRRGTVWQEVCEEEPVAERTQGGTQGPSLWNDISSLSLPLVTDANVAWESPHAGTRHAVGHGVGLDRDYN